MPPTVAGYLPAKGASAPEDLVTVWSDWVELWDVEPTLRVMLRTMAEFAMLVFWEEEETGPSLLWQAPFISSKMEGMHTRKGFSKSAEGNLLQSWLGPNARTCILVTDGSVGKQIGLFEVFLWFSQSEKVFWGLVSSRSNLCDFWIANQPEYSRLLGKYSAVTAIPLANR